MNYIIRHNFYSDEHYYVRTLSNNKEFEEVYNPKFATTFNTTEEAQSWIDTYSSMADFSKIVEASEAIEDYEQFVNGGTVRRTLACINTSMSRPYNGEGLKEVIDWWIYANLNDDEIKFEDYQTWPRLYSISKHLSEVQTYHNKEYTEEYITFEIYTEPKGRFKDFEKELNMVIDKVTLKDGDGYLDFPIFDHYLSEGGNSVSLFIHPETHKVRIGGRWGSDDFDSLKDAFDYMKRERYYE